MNIHKFWSEDFMLFLLFTFSIYMIISQGIRGFDRAHLHLLLAVHCYCASQIYDILWNTVVILEFAVRQIQKSLNILQANLVFLLLQYHRKWSGRSAFWVCLDLISWVLFSILLFQVIYASTVSGIFCFIDLVYYI